ncbi:MAG: glutathione S-transferase N-terminal domain-containing protein [Methylococcaceae bacterium]
MQLLYTKRSPYARKAQIIALEKNIELNLIDEDLANKSPQLLAANPLAKIPVLILDNGETLFDSPVICEYLDNLKDEPLFIPATHRWKVLRWQALADGLMDSVVAIYLEKVRHPNDFNVRYLENQEKNCVLVLDYCQQHLNELAELSLASVSVACALGYMDFRGLAIHRAERYAQLIAWYLEFSKRASMQATIPSN